jgi:hypothetical protein
MPAGTSNWTWHLLAAARKSFVIDLMFSGLQGEISFLAGLPSYAVSSEK